MTTIICPACDSRNTRRVQNELAKIINPPFSQGPEWLGYCHDCGTLYDYYIGRIINNPKTRMVTP